MEGINETEKKPKSDFKNRPVQMDDALTLTTFGKFNYILIILSGFILSTVLLETLGISFVLPVAQCDLHLTTQNKGVLSAIAFAGIISSSHLWGFLADTKGRRQVIMPTLIIAFICTLFSSFTNNFWLFVVLRYFNGFFISGASATIYCYLGEFHNMKNRARAIMGASFVFGIGCMTLPLIAWLVINQEWQFNIPFINIMFKPWRLFMIVCGLPSFICALILSQIPESPRFTISQGDKDQTLRILQRIYAINTGDDKKNYPVTAIIEEIDSTKKSFQHNHVSPADEYVNDNKNSVIKLFKLMWQQTAPLFMKPHLNKTLIACILQFGIFATSNGMYMWFPDILNRMADYKINNPVEKPTICEIVYATRLSLDNRNFSDTETSECNQKLEISTFEHTLVLEVLYALGFAFIGFIINAIGKLPILVFILVGCGAAGISTIFTTEALLATYLYVILLLCGLAITVVNAATVDLFPTQLRAMAVCISLMMGRMGSVVGANIVGIFLDYHCEVTFLTSGISLIACGVLSFFIPNIFIRTITIPKAGPRHSIVSNVE